MASLPAHGIGDVTAGKLTGGDEAIRQIFAGWARGRV